MARDMVHVRRSGGTAFQHVPSANIPRSQIDRSHAVKTTFDADKLVPVFVDEILPGDTHVLKMDGFARIFSPLKAPIMDNIYLDVFYFFVPNRLVWDNWVYFNGEKDDPTDTTTYTVPKITNGTTPSALGDVADYFGIPIGTRFDRNNVNSLPFRAYRLIHEEWFRDENLTAKASWSKGNGPDGYSTFSVLQTRAKKRDYFTSALPWPQKSTDPVTLGLTGTAPVIGLGMENQSFNTSGTYYESDGSSRAYGAAEEITSLSSNNMFVEGTAASNGYPAIFADLTNVTSVTINELRQAYAIQRLLEQDARGGTRYIEIIKSHFGVTNPDYRLQRPEYLGGGRAMVNVSPVAQTSEDGTTKQGQLRGVGSGVISNIGFSKSFTEHGYVIGMVCARPDLTYQQGLDRMWSREDRYDFYWPALAGLGEQAILNREIWLSNVTATDEQVFGYQERYGEYRFKHSLVTGKFRSDAAGSLDLWHLAEDFASLPSLNTTFINYNTPMSRIQSVTTEPDFILDVWFTYRSARPMPLYGIPGLMDRF